MRTDERPSPTAVLGVGLVSATLLLVELALTRIFSVVMYYHFAFLAISVALFGLSASGVLAFVFRVPLNRVATDRLLARLSFLYACATVVALFFLVRLRVGLQYSPENLRLMLSVYALAALPFLTGGAVITLAMSRLAASVGAVYSADLTGAAAGCLLLIPLLDRLGAPGVVLTAAGLALLAAVLFAGHRDRPALVIGGALVVAATMVAHLSGFGSFDVTDTKGHETDRVLFSKWNSFSRIGVYDRAHADWSLSRAYTGPLPRTRFMDIDSAASTPIVAASASLADAQYLRYELTALPYQLKEPAPGAVGFEALVIGPGGGRDLLSALVFGARHVDGVEINPIIANDVMRGAFRDFSGDLYSNPRVSVTVDDGRSFVKRSERRYDVIQASLVDTWAATAAGAYTLTENTLYTTEAFDDYLEHLTDSGVLSITRWVFDGLRLVSLAQEACEKRGWEAAGRIAIIRHDRVATFLLKRTPFTPDEVTRLAEVARRLDFDVVYLPGQAHAASPRPGEALDAINRTPAEYAGQMVRLDDYARLIEAPDRRAFYERYPQDITPTTDDRPFFFHTTKLKDQGGVAFGRTMLFGNGLSALVSLMGMSGVLVLLFVLGPLALTGRAAGAGRLGWLAYFGALGAGFMLVEVALLQQFVLLLGHPVYSLTVTLFSLLLGTGLGARLTHRIDDATLRRALALGLGAVALTTVVAVALLGPVVAWAIPFSRTSRVLLAVALLLPAGMLLGLPMPAGIRLLRREAPDMMTWAWGMNGALSVTGATLAVFVAMNWGFRVTLLAGGGVYLAALAALALVTSRLGQEQ